MTQIPRRGELIGLGILVALSVVAGLVSLYIDIQSSETTALLRVIVYSASGFSIVTAIGLVVAQRIRANYIAHSLLLAAAIDEQAEEITRRIAEPITEGDEQHLLLSRLAGLNRAVGDAKRRRDVLIASGEVLPAERMDASIERAREPLRAGRPTNPNRVQA